MSLASLVNTLAGRVATEFNTLRGEISTSLASKQDTSAKGTASGYAGLDSGGKVPIAQLGQSGTASSSTYLRGDGAWATPSVSVPLVPHPPFTVTYSSSITPDASQGVYGRCALTGSPTLNAPSGGTDGQRLLLRFTASATQTVTFAGMDRMSYINSSLVVSAGKKGYVLVVYDGSTDGWTILAAGATA